MQIDIRRQKPYTTQYMTTIRLTVTPEIRQVLDGIKLRYPPLSEPEILKIALSEFYAKNINEGLKTIQTKHSASAQALLDIVGSVPEESGLPADLSTNHNKYTWDK